MPLVALVLMFGLALVGPYLLPDPAQTSLREARLGLGAAGHPLGTDGLGRDILSRAVSGARVSLLVGIVSVSLCIVIGGALGLVSGFLGGWVDATVMRVMDIVLAFPSLILALTIAAYLGPSVRNVVIAVTVSRVPAFARLARSTTVSLRTREFVWSARLSGVGRIQTMVRHLAPNLLNPLMSYGLLAVGIAIIVESSLSFLGLGVRPPTPTWGVMIAEGRSDLEAAPHVVLVPGAFLFVTILALNMLADGLRTGGHRSVTGS